MNRNVKRALISVSDKSGLTGLAQLFHSLGIEIVSTGGTAEFLSQAGVPVTPVNTVTGFQEILDGRVKTLHPLIHGALLADPDNPGHQSQLQENGIVPFQIVVVNLYPFKQTVLKNPDNITDIIDNIDIGGPCLMRAAAKNHKHVLILTDPGDYEFAAEHLQKQIPFTENERLHLAAKAFLHTSQYDYMITSWLNRNSINYNLLPDSLHILLEKKSVLRYGENPHQAAGIYTIPLTENSGLLGHDQLGGREISFNNLLDTQAAWNMVTAFQSPAAVIVKHQNPCGAAESSDLTTAYEQALSCDPKSAFGGIVALNRPVDQDTAAVIHSSVFLEVIAAPEFDPEALKCLKRKKNRRLIRITPSAHTLIHHDVRLIENGALVQTLDTSSETRSDFATVSSRYPSCSEWNDLLFGWTLVRFVKSNAIVCAHDRKAVGIGAGQMSRVDSVEIALEKAGERAHGAILASDAFFPFHDSIDLAAEAGVTAIIQPGGSKGDQEVVNACNAHDIALVFTGIRHFRH
jgi:phosphoribosylaminoimidazolecarboxamide formyltransferase / IMP cyclohydrolase